MGSGHTTQTVGVTRKALLSAPPGISGLKMLEYLPGFNVQTDGPLGLYEFGNSVQVRAFNLDEIGFVLDGIPMGRSDAFGAVRSSAMSITRTLRASRPRRGPRTLPSRAIPRWGR
ncbi:TonB-dependent receptor plug domain-containing protein [Novosphingobium sp. 9]|uniref:TonB-dependent receptor plug domain-containing protein n=1 Tax=Novosphingobium sp. 9 TaxID=2025349 RepID=UPI0021B4F417|nr:TonB-dependent receptor plug domain-containing protein [Novosphingobium sp. 9]